MWVLEREGWRFSSLKAKQERATRHCRGRRPRRPDNQQTFVIPHGFACIFLTILKFQQAFLAPNDFIQLSKGWRAGHKARKPSETIFAPPLSTTPCPLSDKRPLLPISLYYPVSDPLIRSHPARSVSAIPPKTLYLVPVSFREGRNHLKRRS